MWWSPYRQRPSPAWAWLRAAAARAWGEHRGPCGNARPAHTAPAAYQHGTRPAPAAASSAYPAADMGQNNTILFVHPNKNKIIKTVIIIVWQLNNNDSYYYSVTLNICQLLTFQATGPSKLENKSIGRLITQLKIIGVISLKRRRSVHFMGVTRPRGTRRFWTIYTCVYINIYIGTTYHM